MIHFLSSITGIVCAIIVVLFVLLLAYYISVGNALARLLVKVQEASSGIDVALSKRYGVLKKMFEASKGYMEHEKFIMLESIKLRNNMTIAEKTRAASEMESATMMINFVGEAYPQLASSAVFINLQKSISDTEEHLQAARRLYNSNVSIYNQKIVSFPTSIVATLRGFKTQDMFTIEAAQRDDIDMNFQNY